MEKRFQLDRPGYCKIPIDVLTNTKTFPCICAFVVDYNVYCLGLCLEIIYSSRENSISRMECSFVICDIYCSNSSEKTYRFTGFFLNIHNAEWWNRGFFYHFIVALFIAAFTGRIWILTVRRISIHEKCHPSIRKKTHSL